MSLLDFIDRNWQFARDIQREKELMERSLEQQRQYMHEAMKGHTMSDETKLGFPNPWKPEQSAIALMHLGKLGEELGEAQAAVSRCIIQGINESEPETGKPNKQWLEDELADVMVNIHLVIDYFRLDQKRMSGRTYKKMEHLKQWHKSHSPLVCNNCYTEHDNPGRNCTNAKVQR